ncbi:unnamed protein product [Bathycoccus prasinos]
MSLFARHHHHRRNSLLSVLCARCFETTTSSSSASSSTRRISFLSNTNSTTTTKERERTTRERILGGNEEDALAPKIPFAAKMNFNGFQVRRYKRANRKVSVVLQERTKHLGKKSEVVSVKPGRARNHLIPQKLAKYATEENVEKALREKEEVSEEEEEEHLDEDEEKKKLKLAIKMLTRGNPVTIKRATKRKTDVFNIPITKDDVVKEVAKQKSVDLDSKSIMLDKPIDSLGEFDVPLWVDGRELEEKLKLVVKKKAYK